MGTELWVSLMITGALAAYMWYALGDWDGPGGCKVCGGPTDGEDSTCEECREYQKWVGE